MGKKDDTISVIIELPNGGSIKLEGASEKITKSTVVIAQQLGVTIANKGVLKESPEDKDSAPKDSEPRDRASVRDDLRYEEILDLDKIPKIDRLKFLVRSKLPYGWFNSKEVCELYKDVIEDIPFSTVSTYLKRLTEDDILIRKGEKKNMEYRLNPDVHDQIPVYAFKLETRKLLLTPSLD
ncbi:MAG: hypothetical protein ACXAEU_20140 [Candidatus Hodarchaeales archaeon]